MKSKNALLLYLVLDNVVTSLILGSQHCCLAPRRSWVQGLRVWSYMSSLCLPPVFPHRQKTCISDDFSCQCPWPRTWLKAGVGAREPPLAPHCSGINAEIGFQLFVLFLWLYVTIKPDKTGFYTYNSCWLTKGIWLQEVFFFFFFFFFCR